MTTEEITRFRKEFASIVWSKGEVKERAHNLRLMEAFDKDDSHKEAVERNKNNLFKAQNSLKEKLKGRTYEEWKEFSKKLSFLTQRVKYSAKIITKEKWQKELDELQWYSQVISGKNPSSSSDS